MGKRTVVTSGSPAAVIPATPAPPAAAPKAGSPPTTPPAAPPPTMQPRAPAGAPPSAPSGGGLPTAEAARAQRVMFELLDAHFHVEVKGGPGIYEPGWSDERIAAETKLDPGVVAYYRDAVYGPALNPRIRELEAAVQRLEAKFRDELGTLQTMVRSLSSEMQTAIDLLHSEIAALARTEAKERGHVL